MQSKFFVACNGDLFDTSRPEWSTLPPLRKAYKFHFATISKVSEMKASIRAGGFAFPGGYPLYFIASDGGAICCDCARKQFASIARSIRDKCGDGWKVEALAANYEDSDLHCDHCSKAIPSAYGADETGENGRCDTCGAPCDAGGCTADRSHNIANG